MEYKLCHEKVDKILQKYKEMILAKVKDIETEGHQLLFRVDRDFYFFDEEGPLFDIDVIIKVASDYNSGYTNLRFVTSSVGYVTDGQYLRIDSLLHHSPDFLKKIKNIVKKDFTFGTSFVNLYISF